MKAQLLGGTVDQSQLPAAAPQAAAPQDVAVDAELEQLRAQIDNI
jgi:phage shock protein A